MVDSTDSTSAIMDLTFNHEHERNTVDGKIYSQLASLDSSAFCLCVCMFFLNKKYIFWHTYDYTGRFMTKQFSPDQFLETRLLFLA